MQRPPDQHHDHDHDHDHDEDVVYDVHGPSQRDIDRSWEGYEEGGNTQRVGGYLWKVVIALVSVVILVSMTIGLIGPFFDSSGSTQSQVPERTSAQVLSAIDGRTIVVDYGDGERIVRMIGVSTPAYGSPFHNFAQEVTESWLSGMEVLIEADQEDADIQGRLLRYVYLEGVMINAALILNGLGTASSESPNLRYDLYLADMERQAKESEVGIWDPTFADQDSEDPQATQRSADQVSETRS